MSEILVIHHDQKQGEALQEGLLSAGHHARYMSPKAEDLLSALQSKAADVLFLDPSYWQEPEKELPPFIKSLRRVSNNYTYLCLLSDDLARENAIRMGANTVLSPVFEDNEAANQHFEKIREQAEFLSVLASRIGDDSIDFPSAGGVIARSAFNQLFLSAIDRANRYGEQTYILFFEIENYRELLELDGSYAAGYTVANLSKILVEMRRQSDIIGQTAKNEFGLLLQRPTYETEPVEAANRYIRAFGGENPVDSSGGAPVNLSVTLVALPTAEKLFHETVISKASS